MNNLIKTCNICKKDFLVPIRLSLKARDKRKSCSVTCGNISKRVVIEKQCKFCNKMFEARKPNGMSCPKKIFCSSSCARKCYMKESNHFTGKTLSEEHRDKIRQANSKEKCWNWKGGIYPEIDAQRRRADYKHWRKAVFERDNYTCQICNVKGGTLNADHILSYATHPELRTQISNGRTLCVSCHKATPSYGRNIKYQNN